MNDNDEDDVLASGLRPATVAQLATTERYTDDTVGSMVAMISGLPEPLRIGGITWRQFNQFRMRGELAADDGTYYKMVLQTDANCVFAFAPD